MLLNLATKIFGSSNERILKEFRKDVDCIHALESDVEKLSDEDLKKKRSDFRLKLASGESLENLKYEAFAVVREVSKRVLGLRPFDVQLLGALSLHRGNIAEMRTGEGKTLVATLPAYLNAIEGKGVHVVTVNDYLAARDSEWMKPLYEALGLTVGCITNDQQDDDRRRAYACDITYGTNNEFGFDYLRDNMKFSLESMVQRPFNYAIIDEVDSILIDEARTPLIISGPAETVTDLYIKINKLIEKLSEDHFDIDEKQKSISFTEDGTEYLEQLLSEADLLTEGNLFDIQNISLVHHSNQALRAHKLFQIDKEYIVKDGRVIIIDEFTGRMMEGRRFSEGLHQALEAKEGVAIQNENQTLASITFQNYFRLYPKLSGMTGTAMTEAAEFAEIYNLGVVEIPTNVPIARDDIDDKIYRSFDDKYKAIIKLIEECYERKQPILVGTVSIEKSEYLSTLLKKSKIPHRVLNARFHEQEAQIVAQAGRPGAITIATNMAGRGTDIKLGGNFDARVADEIDPLWEDSKKEKYKQKIRAEVDEERAQVSAAGGLGIIGTERHESRRIDNQLRGRAGRQGDPGFSVFFLSAQDDLMRIFSPEALETVLKSKSLGLKEGEALTHPWLSKALERAQTRVERQNFEIRKNLLKFDNVMNDQRKIIYKQRRDIMNMDDMTELVTNMRHEVIEEMIVRAIPSGSYMEQWDLNALQNDVENILNLNDFDVKKLATKENVANEEIEHEIKHQSDDYMATRYLKGGEFFNSIQKSLILQIIDQNWKEHLLNLDNLRQGINLRAFGQKDPLNEYKTEAFAMFESMLDTITESIVRDVTKVEAEVDQEVLKTIAMQTLVKERDMLLSHPTPNQSEQKDNYAIQNEGTGTVVRKFDPSDPKTWDKVGRNSPCPCGSGKKYKHCHGRIE